MPSFLDGAGDPELAKAGSGHAASAILCDANSPSLVRKTDTQGATSIGCAPQAAQGYTSA
ncbi:hypothetical protein ACXU4B_07505 [Dyella soli]|uniref:Uncharacterized protein n=1 Tax=Dyella soli TaxID=522319 RepID=A0A4R0YPD8_9GAMM|nr:hypothetical protein [Dyella soli]TCI10819.1 hypothetical protein EZM97_18405 [Dyella soli]